MAKLPTVFIHTNHRQRIGAIVARHSLTRNTKHPGEFRVEIISTEDHPFIAARDGQHYLREGRHAIWRYENLQSFTPLRFMPPELMGYEGRAVVIDPDVFALGDVWELLSRDMHGKAIMCRKRSGSKGRAGGMASSVMLLDCAQLRHWNCRAMFDELFEFRRDYMDWICLKNEDPETIGIFENEWNDFDHLTVNTKMLHNTKRQTQPWKTGLPVDFNPASKRADLSRPATWVKPLARLQWALFPKRYRPHPDPEQERLFFTLLRECLESGAVTEELLREEMAKNHVRHDALELLARRSDATAQA